MSEYYIKIDTVEEDNGQCNHLLIIVIKGQEYLISATTDHCLGTEGTRLWVSWTALSCHKVTTIEEAAGNIVTGSVKICTADGIRENK